MHSPHSPEAVAEFIRSGIVPTTVGDGIPNHVIEMRKKFRALGLYETYCEMNGNVHLAEIPYEMMAKMISEQEAGAQIAFVDASPVEAEGGLRLQVVNPTLQSAAKPARTILPRFLDEDAREVATAPVVTEPAPVVEQVLIEVPVHGVTTSAGKYANAAPTRRFVEPPRQVGTIVSKPSTPWTPPASRAKPAPKQTRPPKLAPSQASAGNGSFGTLRDLFPVR